MEELGKHQLCWTQASFLDGGAARRWGIPLEKLPHPREGNSLNAQAIGRITHSTKSIKLLVSGNHQEIIKLLIIESPHSPVILGHPWMVIHNPEMDWRSHDI